MQLTADQRDALGKIAHDEWVVQQQGKNPDNMLGYAPWQTLTEPVKEVYRRVAEAVVQRYSTLK